MDENELKELTDSIKNKAQEAFDNFKKEIIAKADFDAKMIELSNEIKSLKENKEVEDLKKTLTDLKAQSDAQGISITKLSQSNGTHEKGKTFIDAVKEFVQNKDIKEYINNGAKGQSIRVKVAVDMNYTTALTRPTTPYLQLLGGQPVYAPERKLSMTDVIPVGQTESETVTFNQEYSFVDGVTTLTENQATGQTSFMLRPVNLTAGRIGTHLIVSKRALKNEKYLMSHIASRIPQKIKRAEDQEILNGTGAGSGLVGLKQNASAWAAGTFAGTIHGAQQIDALLVAVSQLTQGNYEASGIILNPIDAAKIELIKSTTHEYAGASKAIRGTDGVLRISGIPVIETTAMTAGNFLVGDLKMACEWLLFTPLTMSISDSHASIFLDNEVCINFEEEPVFPIYNPLMFVYGNFATAIAAIDAGT